MTSKSRFLPNVSAILRRRAPFFPQISQTIRAISLIVRIRWFRFWILLPLDELASKDTTLNVENGQLISDGIAECPRGAITW